MIQVFKKLTAGTFFSMDSETEALARAAVAQSTEKQKKIGKTPGPAMEGRPAISKAPVGMSIMH